MCVCVGVWVCGCEKVCAVSLWFARGYGAFRKERRFVHSFSLSHADHMLTLSLNNQSHQLLVLQSTNSPLLRMDATVLIFKLNRVYACMQTCIHTCIHSLTKCFTYHSINHSLTHSLTITHTQRHTLTHSTPHTHSFTHHSITHTHTLTQSPTHSQAPRALARSTPAVPAMWPTWSIPIPREELATAWRQVTGLS